ncbi:serine/threonine-protein kinase [Kitasatospora sp. NPDC098652]|uniref:serine/threonine-protein kinase n=1 Tax=Kitasatospora sp. NPDC098652 TaxID=3364095 RepID=UPI0037FA65D2
MAQEASPGQLIGGKYRLVSSLGSGGFGRVWKAHDEHLDVDIAIKEIWLPPAQFEEEYNERLKRAAREARNAAKLRDHPNIVTVHEVVVDAGRPWIVMQLVNGCSLDEYVRRRGPLPRDLALKVARALLEALDAAHRAGILHRDVKPANVMMASDGRILLTDFGIARHENDTVLTASGTVIGSPEYMAPERIRGRADMPVSDLFSLGVTLFQAVEGSSPFRRETSMASMSAVLMDEPPPLVKARDPLKTVVRLLLEKKPEQRLGISTASVLLAEPSHSQDPGGMQAEPKISPPKKDHQALLRAAIEHERQQEVERMLLNRPSPVRRVPAVNTRRTLEQEQSEPEGQAGESKATRRSGGLPAKEVWKLMAAGLGFIVLFGGFSWGLSKVTNNSACGWMKSALTKYEPNGYTTYQNRQQIINQTRDALDLPGLDHDLNSDLEVYLDRLLRNWSAQDAGDSQASQARSEVLRACGDKGDQ